MKKKKNSLKKIIIISIIILSIFLFILLIIDSSIIDYMGNMNKEPRLFQIRDECNLAMNTLLHHIKSEDECKISCNNECNLRKIDFYNIEFIENNKDCNICNCYCK